MPHRVLVDTKRLTVTFNTLFELTINDATASGRRTYIEMWRAYWNAKAVSLRLWIILFRLSDCFRKHDIMQGRQGHSAAQRGIRPYSSSSKMLRAAATSH